MDSSTGRNNWGLKLSDLIDWEYQKESTAIVGFVANEQVAIFKVSGGTKCILAMSVDDGSLLWVEKEDSLTQKISHCLAGDLLFTAVSGNESIPYALDCHTGEKVCSDESMKLNFSRCIASDKHILYLSTYFDGIVFDWETPYVSPHKLTA